MKVTIEPKVEAPKKCTKDVDLEVGTVFEYRGGVVAVRIKNNRVLLLNRPDGNNYLELAQGYLGCTIEKILGKLTGITVEAQ